MALMVDTCEKPNHSAQLCSLCHLHSLVFLEHQKQPLYVAACNKTAALKHLLHISTLSSIYGRCLKLAARREGMISSPQHII